MANILIPDDLIFVILSLLTVNSLLRFRCVSNKWRDLIDSPGFAKYHLHQSTTTRSVFNIVLDTGAVHKTYRSLKMDKTLNESGDFNLVEESINPFPELPIGSNIRILSSCNGLLCVYENLNYFYVTLLNPSTRKYRTLPHINPENPYAFEGVRWYWGFGYDAENDDYKVLQMSLDSKPTFGWIYSLKAGAWRRLVNLPNYWFTYDRHGRYASNAIHWLVHDPARLNVGALESDNVARSISIGAFDLVTKKFRLVPLPENMIPDDFVQLEVKDGRLCLCYSYDGSCFLDWWIMREYGAKDSWSRVSKLFQSFNELVVTSKPLVFSEDRKLLLFYDMDEGLMLYDLETESFTRKLDKFPSCWSGDDLIVHIPTLVNPSPLN